MIRILNSKLANTYISLVGLTIIPLLYLSLHSIGISDIPQILFWIALEVVSDLKHFSITYKVQMDMTISFAIQFSAVIIFGTYPAVLIILLATLITEIILKKPWKKVIFNTGQYGLSLIASGFVYHFLKLSPHNVPVDIIMDLPAILLSVTVYFLLNAFFISAVISLTTENKLFDVFLSSLKTMASYIYSLTPISIAIALLYRHDQPYIILIMIPPILMADRAMRKYYSLQREAKETLKILATTLDERDKYTFSHSLHVAEYSKKIAELLKLSQYEIEEIEMAGQVHDLGKVGIEDKILNKNGKLTDEEYEIIKKHPEIAYRMFNNLKPYKKCAEYVLHHHERFDGNGYPDKIAGENIPLGARILSVADSYDAMTTDRPYREALSQVSAVYEMRFFAGTQFDPKVVDAFIAVLKKDYGFIEV